jgi:hypothetical protein
MRTLRSIVCGVSLATVAGNAAAGGLIHFTCTGNGAPFNGSILFGGGFTFDRLTGYCPATGRLASLTWETSAKVGEPQPARPSPIQAFDPSSGQTLTMYATPECPAPIVPITSVEQLQRIPPCAGREFTVTSAIDAD